MGRMQPSFGVPPLSQRKDARAKRAKHTINKVIPTLLKAYPRAREGIEASELITNPVFTIKTSGDGVPNHGSHRVGHDCSIQPCPTQPLIQIQSVDTLEAAASLSQRSRRPHSKSDRIAILNMASPLRPGGGFLNGATSQEESLCMRTTLFPALKERFYRLPEIGGIYTPDILVFRSHDAEATDLPKDERFFVDVITATMHRMPEIEEDADGQKYYANGKERVAAEQKIRAVMCIAKLKHVKKLVLGAWGCGAYANPVAEIASAFRKVLLETAPATIHGAPGQYSEGHDTWAGMELIFAIKDRRMAEIFAEQLGRNIDRAKSDYNESDRQDDEAGDDREVVEKIAQLEAQVAAAKSDVLKERLTETLERLKLTVKANR